MRLLGILLSLGSLLAGCASQPNSDTHSPWQQQTEYGALSAQVDPEQQAALLSAMNQRGLMLPSLLLTDQFTLAPDYPLSAKQWAALQQRLGLKLESGGRSLRQFRYLLGQVNEQCPERARRQSASCQMLDLFWLGGFSDNGALPAENLVSSVLTDRTHYLVISNPDLYTLGLMRHGQSGLTTAPLTHHSSSERKAQLAPALEDAHLEIWLADADQPAFSCELRANIHVQNSNLQHQWQTLQQQLFSVCEPAIAALLNRTVNDVQPTLNKSQQEKIQKLLQDKGKLIDLEKVL